MLLLLLPLGLMLVELALLALLVLLQSWDTGEVSKEHFSGGLSFQPQQVC